MLIGGVVPFTLTDYPGEIAAVCFTQGCNFSCPFCHNKQLIPRRDCPDNLGQTDGQSKLMDLLLARKGKLKALVISGGEPTLQRDLTDFLSKVRSLGYKIKLDTNGSRPWVLESLLEKGLADLVAMDIKAPWEKYHLAAGKRIDTKLIERSMELILAYGVDHIFRTTFVPHLLNPEDIDRIRGYIPPGSRYVVQPYVRPAKAA